MAQQDMTNFRENVQWLCADRGSKTTLAQKAGITREYLSEILAGRKSPSLDVAYNIADAIGVGLDLLKLPHRKFVRLKTSPNSAA